MRLLLLTQDFPPDIGGMQTYAFELARRLAPRCEALAVLAPHRPGAEETDQCLPFPVYRIRASSNTFGAASLFPLLKLIRQERFDAAFHVQWSAAVSSVMLRRAGLLRRVFVAAHGRELLLRPLASAPPVQALYSRIRAGVLRSADGLYPVSGYTGGLLKAAGVDPARVTVVHNGVDPDTFRPMDASALRQRLGGEGRPVVLTVCRLVQRKGIDTVLHALPRILSEVPDALYVVVGDGPDRARLEALAAERGLGAHVRFAGKVSHRQLPLYFNACDVFVMPAREEGPNVEGFGLVFLEANACGKPVIGAHSGGIPDAVRHGETGLLVPPGDAGALTESLLRLLIDPASACRLGATGRARVVREAGWDRVADCLYESMLERYLCTSS